MRAYRKSSPGGLQVRVRDRGRRRFGMSSKEDQLHNQGHCRRSSSRINHIVVVVGATGSTTLTEEDQRKDLRPQNISRRIKDIVTGAAGSTTSTEEDQRKDLRPQRISRSIKDIVVGGTADRSSTSTQRIKRICIGRGAAPRSSTSTDTRW